MRNCKKCGSYAINDELHGRQKGVDLDLCDVCYWRQRAERFEEMGAGLAANQCLHPGGIVGDEGGTPHCPMEYKMRDK